ncbi:MAG: hypothetical protein WKG01_24185 [Kofleriaceae bacterium]
MRRCLLVGILWLVACEKKAPEGLPAADTWKSAQPGAAGAAGNAQPAEPPAEGSPNPHGDPGATASPGASPHAMQANPHGAGDPDGAQPAMPPAAPGTANPHGGPQGMPTTQPGTANPHGDLTGPTNPHGMPANPADIPSGAVPDPPPPTTPDKRAAWRLVLGPFTFVAPTDWVVKPVTSSMRAASFVLSAKPKEEAELVVYFFGDSGAGSVQANLDRWVDQFQQSGGKSSKDASKVEQLKIAGQDATLVSVSGRYVAMAMPGGAAADKADQALLAAIVPSPSGPYYFKLVGAKKTVDAHAKRFRTMLASLQLAK